MTSPNTDGVPAIPPTPEAKMPIPIECQGCGFTATVPDAYMGKKVKCKRCGSRVTIPEPEPATVPLGIPELEISDVAFPAVDVGEGGSDFAVAQLLEDGDDSLPPVPTVRVDPEPARRRAPDVGREPWYYGFLAGYAYLILSVGVLAGSFWTTAVIVAAISSADELGPKAMVGIVVGVLPALAVLFGSMLLSAPILLVVDAARTLRAIRAGR